MLAESKTAHLLRYTEKFTNGATPRAQTDEVRNKECALGPVRPVAPKCCL